MYCDLTEVLSQEGRVSCAITRVVYTARCLERHHMHRGRLTGQGQSVDGDTESLARVLRVVQSAAV